MGSQDGSSMWHDGEGWRVLGLAFPIVSEQSKSFLRYNEYQKQEESLRSEHDDVPSLLLP